MRCSIDVVVSRPEADGSLADGGVPSPMTWMRCLSCRSVTQCGPAGWWDSIEWEEKGGARWDSVPHPKVSRVYLKGIGHVRVHQHRPARNILRAGLALQEA